jgi:uncharacterized membrane protein
MLALTLSFIALTDILIILDIPILRQVFGFALLTVLPGFLIIRLLRFGKTSLEKTLFLIGLSVSFLLFVPLLMNFAYPPIGIARPISLLPLVTTFSVILVGLSLAAFRKDSLGLQINTGGFKQLTGKIATPPVLGAAFIVVLGILGGLSLMFYLDSILSLLLELSIVLIVVLIITDKVLPRFYPLYILVIAVALQYARMLASPNLFGSDAMFELYFANLVKASGVWVPSFSVSAPILSDYYAMLSVAILPNVYSILLNLSTVWVFKLVYPIIFAFVPLGLYQIFRTQIKFSSKSAFLSVFFFVSFFAFGQAMPIVTRQEIAELFFVLAALLIMKEYPQPSKKAALLIIFIGSMVVSHYATSYLFLLDLTIVCAGSAFIRSRTRQKRVESAVSITIVVLAVVITFGWYLFVSAGTPYIGLLDVGTQTVHTFSTELFANNDPLVTAAVGGTAAGLSLFHILARYWQVIAEVLILTGLASAIWLRKAQKMSLQFILFSLASLFIMLAVIAVPSLGGAIGSWRSYSIALLFLAPCCIFGVEVVVETISGWLGVNRGLVLKLTSVAFIVLLVPYFLFNYGFIYEIAENPANYAFLPTQNSNGRGVEYLDNASWSFMITAPVPIESVYASTWLSGHMGQSQVYADGVRAPELAAYGNISPNSIIDLRPMTVQPLTVQPIPSNAYIYLGAGNVQNQSIALELTHGNVRPELSISSVPELATASRVYDNGLAEVYRTQ